MGFFICLCLYLLMIFVFVVIFFCLLFLLRINFRILKEYILIRSESIDGVNLEKKKKLLDYRL